jgi:hypothetical protein
MQALTVVSLSHAPGNAGRKPRGKKENPPEIRWVNEGRK